MRFAGWLMVIVGFAIHLCIRARLSIADPKTRWSNAKQFLNVHWPAITVRFFLIICLWWAWTLNAGFVNGFLQSKLGAWATLPPTPPVAGFFGLTADFFIDVVITKWFPGLKRDVPSIEQTGQTTYMSVDDVPKADK